MLTAIGRTTQRHVCKPLLAGRDVHACNPDTWRMRQENYKFKAYFGYIVI
jgi:hypothetical protein